MCGIAAAFAYKSEKPEEVRLRIMRFIFTYLFQGNEERGRDATGFYQVLEDGDWMLAKRPGTVSDWIAKASSEEDNTYSYRDILSSWDQLSSPPRVVVGHCRKATVGSRGADNNDNHPFAVPVDAKNALLGVHNGTLVNDHIIESKIGGLIPRQGKVDSEILFHLLYIASDLGQRTFDNDAVQRWSERIQGAYNVISVNTKFPSKVLITRKDRELSLLYIREYNLLFLSSERRVLEEATRAYTAVRISGELDLPALDGNYFVPLERTYFVLDLEKPLKASYNLISTDMSEIRGDLAEDAPPSNYARPNAVYVLADWRAKSTAGSTPSYTPGYSPAAAPVAGPTAPAETTPIAPNDESEDEAYFAAWASTAADLKRRQGVPPPPAAPAALPATVTPPAAAVTHSAAPPVYRATVGPKKPADRKSANPSDRVRRLHERVFVLKTIIAVLLAMLGKKGSVKDFTAAVDVGIPNDAQNPQKLDGLAWKREILAVMESIEGKVRFRSRVSNIQTAIQGSDDSDPVI